MIAGLDKLLFKGPFTSTGTPDSTGKLTPEQVEKIKAFTAAIALWMLELEC